MNALGSSAGASPDDAANAPVPRRRVVICDDHPLFRMGLATALAADPTLRLVGEASTAAECIQRLVEHRPEVGGTGQLEDRTAGLASGFPPGADRCR